MNETELGYFYHQIGAALWHIQHLEDALVNFLVAKIVHEQRRAGKTVTMPDAEALLAEKRKLTLGPLIDTCTRYRIISKQAQHHFAKFREERHWLVHRSLAESGDDLYSDPARATVFKRIATVRDDTKSLKDQVVKDLENWMASHGVNVDEAGRNAEAELRKLAAL